MNVNNNIAFSRQLIKSSNTLRLFGYVILVLVALIIIALIYVPWMQTVNAKGQVTALSPSERPQYIESQIVGRVSEWKVKEGQMIKKGDTIVVFEDIDPKFIDPDIINNTQQQLTATEDRARSIIQQIDAFKKQVTAEQEAQKYSVQFAQEALKQANQKSISLEAQLKLENLNLEVALQRFQDRKDLYEKGLKSVREYEQAKISYQEAQTKIERLQADLTASRNAESQAEANVKNKMAEGNSKILKSLADESKSIESMSSITSSIAKSKSELNSIIQRRTAGVVKAQVDCRIVRLYSFGKGEIVKQGEPLAIIAPVSRDQAVEVYVSGNDAPLIQPGTSVRIQFDGFPALQVSGWPQATVGTYGGIVQIIDVVDDDNARGMFRVIIKPDTSMKNEIWPSQEYLRPGTMVRTWMQLNQVPLGYELWRQFNGLPLSPNKPTGGARATKKSKEDEGEKKSYE
ncbi:MAG: HlyD family efflux transporter periplasmic adaptor subunit [Bacteroidetes bacterium]|nr:HlyD family efflux transporter periplasmic adaptor subunit [Bacteroidota bacterium]